MTTRQEGDNPDQWDANFGFVPEQPTFELYGDGLTPSRIQEAFAAALKERGHALHFKIAGHEDDEKLEHQEPRLSLVVEGLQVVDSGPYSALRGEPWHYDGAMWVITGWGFVFRDCAGDRRTYVAGPCRVLTPRSMDVGDVLLDHEIFVGQFQPPRHLSSGERIRPIKYVKELWT